MTNLPFSQAAENNKKPILDVLHDALSGCQTVLEVGSGTGQHSVWFGQHLPHLLWQPSEQQQNLHDLNLRLAIEAPDNVRNSIALDVADVPWPVAKMDAVFAANCVHIMSWPHVEKMFAGVSDVLSSKGRLVLYGPYKYRADFTSDSNARFDEWLRANDPKSGIRDFEKVDILAKNIGLTLQEDHPMPANNQCIIWQKNN